MRSQPATILSSNGVNAGRSSEPLPQVSDKYREYLSETREALAGKLSRGERKRRNFEYELLQRAHFVEVNGLLHHYYEAGPANGEPLILVHGWDCSSYWWNHIVDPLGAAGYRVICYDLKGHGFSENDPRRNYTVAGFSDDLRALAEALELGPHHVAAFSLGAFVTLHYAAAYPERVRSLTLFNFSVLEYNSVAAKAIPHVLSFVFNTVLRPIERRNLWVLPFLYARLVLAKNTPPVRDVRLGTLSLRCCDPEAIKVSTRELVRRETLEAVPQQMQAIKQPTLLVAGANDPIMQPAGGRKLIDHAEQGIFLEIPRCGHLILFELPEQVIQIMRLFLRGNR